MTDPADPAGDPVRAARHVPRLPLGASRIAAAGWSRSSPRPRRSSATAKADYTLARHRWRADPRERDRRRVGIALAWRLFGAEPRPSAMPARPERGPRDRPPGLPFLYRASLNKWWFDDLYHLLFMRHRRPGRRTRCGGSTARSSTAPSTPSAPVTVDAGRGLRRIQTGPGPELRPRHRHRLHRDGRLVPHPGGPLMNVDRPADPVDHHVPAADRRDRRRDPARPTSRD